MSWRVRFQLFFFSFWCDQFRGGATSFIAQGQAAIASSQIHCKMANMLLQMINKWFITCEKVDQFIKVTENIWLIADNNKTSCYCAFYDRQSVEISILVRANWSQDHETNW